MLYSCYCISADLDQLYSALKCKCDKGHITRDDASALASSSNRSSYSMTDPDGDGGSSEPFQIVSSGGKRGGSGHKKRGGVGLQHGGNMSAGGRSGVAAKINHNNQG